MKRLHSKQRKPAFAPGWTKSLAARVADAMLSLAASIILGAAAAQPFAAALARDVPVAACAAPAFDTHASLEN